MKTSLRFAVGSAKWLWRITFVTILVLSLSFNFIAIFGGAVFGAVSSAVGSITGAKTLVAQHADEIADLNADLVAERRVQRELRGDVADISGDLAVARTANRELRDEVTELGEEVATSKTALRRTRNEVLDLSEDLAAARLARRQLQDDLAEGLVIFKGRKIALREAVEETADTVSSRAAKSATRNTASMAGEALPYVGTAVIVGVTALEINDLCQTIRDMNTLKRAFNPDLQPSEEELTVCSMAVPSRQEVWNAALAAPGKAWDYSREAVPKLADLRDIELPSWGDLWAIWDAVKGGAQGQLDVTEERGKELYRWLTD